MARKLIVEISRLLLGVVFIFSSIVKGVDLTGIAIKMEEYLRAMHLAFLHPAALPLGAVLCLLEFMIGAMLLMGIYRRLISKATLVVMVGMTGITLWLALSNPVADCGCFGDALKLTNWETFYKNVVLLAAAICVAAWPNRMSRLFKRYEVWSMALIAMVSCLWFLYANYKHLPMWDFRPYKVGLNLYEATHLPDDAPQDEYKYEFVYEKEGKKQSFDIDNLPEDTTWRFVERKETLIKKGAEPLITDFELYNDDSENVAEPILQNKKGAILLMMPYLQKVSTNVAKSINEFYQQCVAQGYLFYGVSAANAQTINQWRMKTRAIYPMLFMDPTTIKTVIRANPGMVVLKSGIIVDKMNHYDMPTDPDKMNDLLDRWFVQDKGEKRHPLTLVPIGVWGILCLLALGRRTQRKWQIKQTK